jgi:hypothetical protein
VGDILMQWTFKVGIAENKIHTVLWNDWLLTNLSAQSIKRTGSRAAVGPGGTFMQSRKWCPFFLGGHITVPGQIAW